MSSSPRIGLFPQHGILIPRAVVLVCFWFFLTQPSLVAARTWRDQQGRAINAKFVRTNGTVVVLRTAAGRVIMVPLVQLSPEDQQYVRQKVDRTVPGARPLLPSEAQGAFRSPPLASEVRTWTDVLGNTMQANLVDAGDGTVTLDCNGKIGEFPIENLSPADQQYVRQALDPGSQGNDSDGADDILPPQQDQPPSWGAASDAGRTMEDEPAGRETEGEPFLPNTSATAEDEDRPPPQQTTPSQTSTASHSAVSSADTHGSPPSSRIATHDSHRAARSSSSGRTSVAVKPRNATNSSSDWDPFHNTGPNMDRPPQWLKRSVLSVLAVLLALVRIVRCYQLGRGH